ncbi:MAG TPA: DUF92 domain-containing protein [Anaerolineaceae bacterium]|nr:DUF92 domain-containing protein [Anaerolineaceae bacterium]
MGSIEPLHLLLACLAAALVAGAAYAARALSASGGLAAFVLGSIVFGLGGFSWAVVLVVFFVTSSGLSFLFKNRKAGVEADFSKSGRRDAGQVIANGGVAGAAVLVHALAPQSALPWVAFCAALAAANADTWATELGVLSRQQPRMMTTWKVVAAGTSGGISTAGTAAAALGATLIAMVGLMLWPSGLGFGDSRLLLAGFVLLAGLAGSLVDSLLGATLQAIYWCPVCKKETEKHPQHSCGTATIQMRGLPWLNNDWVNLACTGSAAALAVIFSLLVI